MNNPEYLEKDFYADLGVSKDASAADVKKAYRKLAQKHHPDANKGDKASEERFKEVGRAYAVLSDPKKRTEYDEARRLLASGGSGAASRFRRRGRLPRRRPGPGRGPRRARRPVREPVRRRPAVADRGPARPRRRERGHPRLRGGGPRGHHPAPAARPGALPHLPRLGRQAGTLPRPCPTCNGRGTVTRDQGLFGLSSPCPTCQGRGSVIDDPCPTCQGRGSEVRTRELRVRIPVGVNDGATVRLKGQGEPGQAGAPAGDLIVKVQVTPHPLFGRNGQDLTITVPVTFAEAALGTELKVPTLDGPVTLKVPDGTQNGRTFRVRGRGVPGAGRKGAGDLLVSLQVAVPEKLSRKERDLLREFASLSDTTPRNHLGID